MNVHFYHLLSSVSRPSLRDVLNKKRTLQLFISSKVAPRRRYGLRQADERGLPLIRIRALCGVQVQSYERFLKRQSISLFFSKKSPGYLLSLKIIMYFASQSKTMLIVDCWRCQLRVIKMPSHGVGDAFYGVIVGFTHSVSSHPLLSWKVSERPLVGIVISIPPILQCLDSNIKNRIKIQK